jgi:hypothetical protein
MKKSFLFYAFISSMFTITLVSCKKDNEFSVPVKNSNTVPASTLLYCTGNVADTPYLNTINADTPYLSSGIINADTPYLRK